MLDLVRKIIKPKYQSLNTIEIIKDNLISNLNYLYSLQEQAEMFPVLKSNAYGHGLKEVSRILNYTPVKMVAIDSFPEAQIVYKNFRGEVLFLSELPKDVYKYCKLKRSEFIVYNQETLKYLSRFGQKIKIHLFLNTGMNREGIDNLEEFIKDNKKYLDKVQITGFCSHLVETSEISTDFTQKQERLFLEGLEILHKNKIYPKWIHLGNSGGVFKLKNKVFNAFRPGIAFYGYNPFGCDYEAFSSSLKPALRVSSTIVKTHKINPGERVSYSHSFIAEKSANIAVIPFGYFEGLDRRFSNCAKLLFSKEKEIFWAKIAGNVCMNLCCLDCQNNEIKIGDQVEIISEIKNFENSIDNLSQVAGIINYEILTGLNSNIRRVIV